MEAVNAGAAVASDSATSADTRPILLVPYMWIGDFVRCHSVVRLLKQRFPQRPVDVLTNALCAPLLDYMPGVRKGIMCDLPRGRLALARQRELAQRLRAERYGTALVTLRTWKSALAPFLAGIPERVGFFGEGRLILLNDVRFGERRLRRMVERCAALALPAGDVVPAPLPPPQLTVAAEDVRTWRHEQGLAGARPLVAFAPGAVGPAKRWPIEHYAEVARRLAADGATILVLGAPHERALAAEIAAAGGERVRDLTGPLRDSVLALAAADLAVANDSGLLHVAAAIGTPAIGIFGPTDPRLWAPLNPLAAVVETRAELPCHPCGRPTCALGHHRCLRDVAADEVLALARKALAEGGTSATP
jgi:lipopolysaccharide heptosyltransferase II